MRVLSEAGRRACRAGLIGVPLLLLVGLVLWLLWIVTSSISGDPVDWSLVLWTWGGLFFLSAILGMFGGHWNLRISYWWHGRVFSSSRVSMILTMSTTLPVAAFIVMVTRMRSDGLPSWLWSLAGFTIVLGIATIIDEFRSTGRGSAAPCKRSTSQS
jgi:hypothetical protein